MTRGRDERGHQDESFALVPPHAAAAYGAPVPQELTTLGVLAFGSALLATCLQVVHAVVVGPAVRTVDESGEVADLTQLAYAGTALFGLVALVAGWVTGSLWLHRARTNAELFEPTYHFQRSAGWAWGGWVCPVVNFWFPFQVVRDTYRAVSPLGTATVFGWWWASWVAVTVVDRIADRVEARSLTDGTNASGATSIAGVLAVLMVVALAGWGLVLRTITVQQRDRAAGRTAAAAGT